MPVPDRLADRLDGLLFFPVTPATADGELATGPLREHVRAGVDGGAAAVFACCGTGEFAALSLPDYAAAVRVAVQEAAGRVPVVAGAGYGTALARQYAAAAQEAGADALLVLPPYLVRPAQEGLVRHFEELAARTPLDLLLYQRDNAVFTPASVVRLARRSNVVGLKDGHGDLDLLERIMSAERGAPGPDPLVYLNGLATAEMSARAYLGLGVGIYSSAVYCFAPRIAMTFYRSLRAGDRTGVDRLLDDFYRPLVELRGERADYAVSLVKAGVRLTGLDVGPVRAPLAEPAPEHVEQLEWLLEQGNKAVDGLLRSGSG